jgi:ADP-heptose:LPS heptosyltransferase
VKILLVRVSSLGDVLHNLPMVADILRHHPQATIDWVVEEGYVSLVRLNPARAQDHPVRAAALAQGPAAILPTAPRSRPSSAPCAKKNTTSCSTPRAC